MKLLLVVLSAVIIISCGTEVETMNEEAIKQEVIDRVKDWDHTWADLKDSEKLKEFFHENMICITPSDREMIQGKAANLKFYQGFMDSAEVVSWELIDPVVKIYAQGTVAVLATYYKIIVAAEPENVTLEGRDLMTLVKENGQWVIVADQFSPYPKDE